MLSARLVASRAASLGVKPRALTALGQNFDGRGSVEEARFVRERERAIKECEEAAEKPLRAAADKDEFRRRAAA